MDGPEKTVARIRTPRVFELKAPTSAELRGKFDEWPVNIQDAVAEAMEKLMLRERINEVVIQSTTSLYANGMWHTTITVVEVLSPEDVRITYQ